MVSNYLLK